MKAIFKDLIIIVVICIAVLALSSCRYLEILRPATTTTTTTATSTTTKPAPSVDPSEGDDPPSTHVHTPVTDAAVPATCEDDGKTEGSHCSTCNEVITAQQTISATGHKGGDWIIDKNATAEEAGSKHKECSTCGKTAETKVIPMLNMTFELRNNGESYGIKSLTGFTEDTLVLPSTYLGKPVTCVYEGALMNLKTLETLVIPDSITSIYYDKLMPFEGCDSLRKMVLGNGLNPYYFCYILAEIPTLAEIDVSEGNTKFKSVDNVLYSYNGETLYCYPASKEGESFTIPEGVKSLEMSAFGGCIYLKNLTTPTTLEMISGSFYNCEALETVTLNGNSLTMYSAFANCPKLKKVIMNDGVNSMVGSGFNMCPELEELYISKTLTTMSEVMFLGCPSVRIIEIDEENPNYKSCDNAIYSKDGTVLYFYAQGNTATSFEVPDGVTKICDYAFWKVNNLKSITLPASLTEMECYALTYCTSLESITVSEDNTVYTSIDGDLYTKDGSMLLTYAIGKKDRVFTLPTTVKKLQYDSISGAMYLEQINLPDGIESVTGAAFENCASLVSINISENSERFKTIDGCLFSKDGKTMISYAKGSKAKSYTIPEGVENMEYGCFTNTVWLEELIFPESMSRIDSWGLAACPSIKSVTIPVSITGFGMPFIEWTSLKKINYEGTVEQWNTMQKDLYFENDWSEDLTDCTVICTDGTVLINSTNE